MFLVLHPCYFSFCLSSFCLCFWSCFYLIIVIPDFVCLPCLCSAMVPNAFLFVARMFGDAFSFPSYFPYCWLYCCLIFLSASAFSPISFLIIINDFACLPCCSPPYGLVRSCFKFTKSFSLNSLCLIVLWSAFTAMSYSWLCSQGFPLCCFFCHLNLLVCYVFLLLNGIARFLFFS